MKTHKISNSMDAPLMRAKSYYGRFFESGPVKYPESNEMVYISAENLPKFVEGHKGVPIIIEHEDLTVDNIAEHCVGYVARTFINNEGFTDDHGNMHASDGWGWALFTVHDQDAISLLDGMNWKLSNEYFVTQKGDSGEYNAIPYNYEVLDINPVHIAIVQKPRYTDVKVISNSRKDIPTDTTLLPLKPLKQLTNNKLMNAFKNAKGIFKKNEDDKKDNMMAPPRDTLDRSSDKKDDNKKNEMTDFEVETKGEKKPFSEIMEHVKNHMMNSKSNEDMESGLENEYDMGDDKMTGHDILNYYNSLMSKENAEDETDIKENAEDEAIDNTDESLEQALEEETKKDNKGRVRNSVTGFNVLEQARNQSISIKKTPLLPEISPQQKSAALRDFLRQTN